MIAVDTNILVYAHSSESPFFTSAASALRRLAECPESWAIPWPCIHEFYSVVTNPRIHKAPSSPGEALAQIDLWRESPFLRLIGETGDHLKILSEILTDGKIVGPKVHDARIAAICRANGVREFWSADRDFSRMRGLKITNPLLPH